MSSIEWLSILVAMGSVASAIIAILAMRPERKPRREKTVEGSEVYPPGQLPSLVKRSVTHTEVEGAKDKLRVFGLEREILSYAIRRLYEAQAEGKITEEERNGLAEKYKEDMRRMNEEISRGESVIALDELESMQEDLLKLFNERFDQLSARIEDLRIRSGFEPVGPIETAEEEKQVPATPKEPEVSAAPGGSRKRRKAASKKAAPPAKSEAERKVEQIMAEVEKVLARLEQMEVSE